MLTGAWEEYAKSLETGSAVELEAEYTTWVAKAMSDSIALPLSSG